MKSRLKISLAALMLFFVANIVNAQMRPGTTKLMEIKDSVELKTQIEKLLAGGEEENMDVLQYYQAKQNQQKSNELTEKIAGKYPKGEVAAMQMLMKIYKEQDMDAVDKLVKETELNFEKEKRKNLYVIATDRAMKNKSIEHFLKYWGMIEEPDMKDMVLKLCGPGLIKTDPNKMKALFDEKIKNYDVQKSGLKGYYDLLAIQSDIYTELGDPANALKAIEPVFLFQDKRSDDFLLKYADLLIANNQPEKAFVLQDSLIRKGKGNEKLKADFSTNFTKLFPAADANQYLSAIYAKLNEQLTKDIGKEIIKEKAPNFKITDAKGKAYSLADFKGKYLVLDFWATWCGPCKKSFPAMQQAVNSFKNQKDVQFLFIHTWENSKTPVKDAVNYLKDNNYTFDLYMDLKDKKTEQNPAVSSFGVTGIPAKFVIDPDGNIRYKGSGFGGGNDMLVAELTAIIDYVRANK